ncbi:MAG: glucosaminidase domain-containing protein [Treponema sp.]|jgi:hypothetical protein|nr:glucosaminidase domain-containing protein [Treponema sp.]
MMKFFREKAFTRKVWGATFLFIFVLLPALFASCAAVPTTREPAYPQAGSSGQQAGSSGPVQSVTESKAILALESTPSENATNSAPETFLSSIILPATRQPVLSSSPERRVKPPVPEYIMGKGLIPSGDMAAFLLYSNPGAEKTFVENLSSIYLDEAEIEGVNHDAAFAQMCLETGFLKFGNLVTADMNNFCGLGAIGPGQEGLSFPDPRTGVRAHIQHLKAYATEAPLKQELVDPRFFYVRFGSSPAIKGLSGTWAVDRSYADKINNILERLYSFSFEK